MKKTKAFILLPLLTSLSLGLISIFNSKKAESVEASSLSLSNGTFVRVESEGQISYGMDVIIVSDDGYALDDVWGNPAFVHGTRDGVSVFNDGKYITLTNSKATVFHAIEGYSSRTIDGETQKSFSFLADVMSISGQKKTNVYFAHNEEENYSGRHDYDYVGWFKDYDIAVQQRWIKESSWYLEFGIETDDFDNDFPVTHIRNAKNVEGDPNTELGFTHYYSDRFVSGGTNRVYIYRRFSESEYSIHVMKQPTKTTYEFGENIDLSGLEIILNTPLHKGEDIVFDDNSADFSFPETAYGSGTIDLECYYSGFKFVIHNITVTRPEYIVNKIYQISSNYKGSYKGSYMLVNEFWGYSFNTKGETTNLSDAKARLGQDDQGRTKARSSSDYDDSKFTLIEDNYGYHLINGDGNYLDLKNFKMTSDSSTCVELVSTSDGIRVKSPSRSDSYLYFNDDYQFGIGSSDAYDSVVLYEYPISPEEQSSFNTYLANFLTTTDVCDETGVDFHISQSDWETLATTFGNLPLSVQAMFVNIEYTPGQVENRSKEFAMSRYDYIYQKYHNSAYSYINDFMGRSAAGTMETLYTSPNVSLLSPLNNNTSLVVIIVISMCSITTIGALLVIKKRRA